MMVVNQIVGFHGNGVRYLHNQNLEIRCNHSSIFLGLENVSDTVIYCLSPTDETFSIPLQIILMLFRHVLHDGAVLARAAEQSPVGSNAVIVVEHLYHISGDTHIDLLIEVLVRNQIVHFVQGYVIIHLYSGYFPSGKLVWGGRQRKQHRFFFGKENAEPTPLFLLEWGAVHLRQLFTDGLIKLMQIEELSIPQGG